MQVTSEVKQRVVAKLQSCRDTIKAKYGMDLSMPRILFTKKGTTAGTAHYGRWEVNFNPVLLMENVDTFIARTVPHEFAHLACDKIYPEAHRPAISYFSRYGGGRVKREVHGPRWQSIMVALGVTDVTRCHSYDVTSVRRKKATYQYKCSCGRTFELGPKRHAKEQRYPGTYTHCRGHRLVLQGHTPAATKVATTAAHAATNRVSSAPSKFDQCYELYKLNVGLLSRDAMINLFMYKVNMTKAGATTYFYKCKG